MEPNRDMAKHHRRKRPRDKLIEAAVSTDGKPSITFYHFEPSTMSTAGAEQAKGLIEAGKYKLVHTEVVSAVQPSEIAAATGGRAVDLLSIDIEGNQLQVVKQFFAVGIKPSFVCCETVHYDGGEKISRDEAAIAFFQNAGYIVIGDTLINTIFADPAALSYKLT